jgi:hypothetical protein
MELDLRSAGGRMHHQDKIRSRFSNDKVDIAGALARVIRTLSKALPLTRPRRRPRTALRNRNGKRDSERWQAGTSVHFRKKKRHASREFCLTISGRFVVHDLTCN